MDDDCIIAMTLMCQTASYNHVVVALQGGGGYCSSSSSSSEEEVPEVLWNESIESFLHSRLMIQLLCNHYISLGRGKSTGAISLWVDVEGFIADAVTEERHVCDANLGIVPEFCIIALPPEKEDDGAMVVAVGRWDDDDDDSHPPPPQIIRSWLHHEEVGIVPAPWMEIDEAALIALRDGPIAICNTAYGRFDEQKKRDMKRAYQKMTATEKDVFKQKMAEYDKADADVGETPPPTPTPV